MSSSPVGSRNVTSAGRQRVCVRVYRGGGYDLCAVYARSSYRDRFTADQGISVLGFRPARRIER